MNTAVALVDAYLQINGYFTIAEYPLVECFQNQPARSVTDIDLLAYRFPQAGRHGEAQGTVVGSVIENVDPKLHCPLDRPDMLFCEVKEGRPHFNDAGHDPGNRSCVGALRLLPTGGNSGYGACSLKARPRDNSLGPFDPYGRIWDGIIRGSQPPFDCRSRPRVGLPSQLSEPALGIP